MAAGLVTWLIPEGVHAFTNRTTGYLPALLALIFFGVWAWRAGSPAGAYNLVAAGMLLVSATFRNIDPDVCPSLPIGTHFLWHVGNGVMLGLILAAVAKYGRAKPAG